MPNYELVNTNLTVKTSMALEKKNILKLFKSTMCMYRMLRTYKSAKQHDV